MFMMQALSEDRSCQRSVNAWAVHRVAEGLSAQERQVAQLDFSLAFQVGHPLELELAQRILGLTPESLQQVFFVNSGSESVDTVLEIAAARHRVRGARPRACALSAASVEFTASGRAGLRSAAWWRTASCTRRSVAAFS